MSFDQDPQDIMSEEIDGLRAENEKLRVERGDSQFCASCNELAAQNEQLRRALDIAHAHADSLADNPEELRIVNEARLLPYTSTIPLARVKAEAFREVAEILSNQRYMTLRPLQTRTAEEAVRETRLAVEQLAKTLRAKADEIEKGEPK